LKINNILSVDLLEHAFLAKKVQAILDELWLHSDTHAEGALESLDYPTHISDLLACNTVNCYQRFVIFNRKIISAVISMPALKLTAASSERL
jgi:hypothetical protein